MSLLPGSRAGTAARPGRRTVEAPPLAYAGGLFAAALAMLAFPVSYMLLGAGLLRLLHWHLVRNYPWVAGPEAGFLSGGFYLLATVVLTGFCAFHFLPLLGGRARAQSDAVLSREAEPRLHDFVRNLSAALGSPLPIRIQVSMDVNASARLAPGWRHFWGGGLELVVGLPLVRGLDQGQFAGVIAHELGHFRQGTAMRMAHAIRSMNQWFARSAAREYAFEGGLAMKIHRMDPFLLALCWGAHGCAAWARMVLKAHAWAGHAASGVLLRQMEFQADKVAIGIVGGDTFASMVLEAKVIESAWGLANRSLGLSLREGRLADDLPALVSAHTRVFIPDVRRRMERGLIAEKSTWFDTHPSLGERVERARRAGVRGAFRSKGPARSLFADFQSLSLQATMAFYQRDLGEDFNPSRMIPSADLATGQSHIQVGEAAVAGYFLGLLTSLRPWWPMVRQPSSGAVAVRNRVLPPEESGELKARLIAARSTVESEYARAAGLYRAFSACDARMLDAVQALALMRANYWIEPGDFQLRKGGAAQAAQAFAEAEADQRSIADGLALFEDAMRTRIDSALRLLADGTVRGGLADAGDCAGEAERLFPVLAMLAAVQPRLESLRRSVHGMGILLQNLEGDGTGTEIEAQLRTHALAIRLDLEAVAAGLGEGQYPFASAESGGLAAYALDAFPSERDYPGHYSAGEETLGRCYALYFRICGRLALAAGRVEGVLGLGPLRVEA